MIIQSNSLKFELLSCQCGAGQVLWWRLARTSRCFHYSRACFFIGYVVDTTCITTAVRRGSSGL